MECSIPTRPAVAARRCRASWAIKEGQRSFIQPSSPSLRKLVGDTISRFESEIYADFVRLHREQPLYAAPEVTAWLGKLVESREFKEIFHLN
ncbi:MAG TPA: hypothetical protein VI669_10760 [Vicinamibacteria bacterium]